MSSDDKSQNQSYERKVVDTDELVRKGYRPAIDPISPDMEFEPQPTSATPLPAEPTPPTEGGNTSGQGSGDSGE